MKCDVRINNIKFGIYMYNHTYNVMGDKDTISDCFGLGKVQLYNTCICMGCLLQYIIGMK